MTIKAYGAHAGDQALESMDITRRVPGSHDVTLGANEVVVSRNADEMEAHAKSLDFILNTVAAPHDLDVFFALLKRDVKYRFVIDCESLAV